MAADWRTAELGPATDALLQYTEKLTIEPAMIGAEDIAILRSHGFDDEGISSCVRVVAYFNYINRIAEGLGAVTEDWIAEDGRPKPV